MQGIDNRGWSLEVKVAIAAAAIFVVAGAIATFLCTQGGLSAACSSTSLGALYICVGLAGSGLITLGILGVKAAVYRFSHRGLTPPPNTPISCPGSPVAAILDDATDDEEAIAPLPPHPPVSRPGTPVAAILDEEEVAAPEIHAAPLPPPSPVPFDLTEAARFAGPRASPGLIDRSTSARRASASSSSSSFHSVSSENSVYEDPSSPPRTALEELEHLKALFPELTPQLNAFESLLTASINLLKGVFGEDENGDKFRNHLLSLITDHVFFPGLDSPEGQYRLLSTFIKSLGHFKMSSHYPIASLLDAYHGEEPDLVDRQLLVHPERATEPFLFPFLFPPEARRFVTSLTQRFPNLFEAWHAYHKSDQVHLPIEHLQAPEYAADLKTMTTDCVRCILQTRFRYFGQLLPPLLKATLPILLDLLEHPARLRNHMEAIDRLSQVSSFAFYHPDNLVSHVAQMQAAINAARAKSMPSEIGIQVCRREDDRDAFNRRKKAAKKDQSIPHPHPIQKRKIEELLRSEPTIVDYFWCDYFETDWWEGTDAVNDWQALNVAPVSILALRKGDSNNRRLLDCLHHNLTVPTPEEERLLAPLLGRPEIEKVYLVFNEMPNPMMAQFADSKLMRVLMGLGSFCSASFVSGKLISHIQPLMENMIEACHGTPQQAERLIHLLLAVNNNSLHNSFMIGYREALPSLLERIEASSSLEDTLRAVSDFIASMTQQLRL